MKKSVIALLISLSTQCFAIEVAPGVELLYEYGETTGNAISGHIEKLEIASFFGYRLTAGTQTYYGQVNHNVTMQGRHSISLTNPT